MHQQNHKMHVGEIMFHLFVPLVMAAVVTAMGYYVVVLLRSIMSL